MSTLPLERHRRTDHPTSDSDGSSRLTGWRGDAREARWRRRRLRKIAAVGCCALALFVLVRSLAPRPALTTHITVAARAVPPGTRLTANDLRQREVPDIDLPGRVTREAAIGHVTVSALAAGEPILKTRLMSEHQLIGDERAVMVPVASVGAAALPQPGERVDLFGPHSAAPVITSVRVLHPAATAAEGKHDLTPVSKVGAEVLVAVPAARVGTLMAAISTARTDGGSLELVSRAAAH